MTENNSSSPASLLVIGEALLDMVPNTDGNYTAHAGGSLLNVAVGAARLGIPTQFATGISDQPQAAAIRTKISENGIDAQLCQISSLPPPRAFVTPNPAGDSYTFALENTAERAFDCARLKQHFAEPVTPPAFVHFGSFAAYLEPTKTGILPLVQEWQARGSVISFDPNIRPAILPDHAAVLAHTEAILPLCNLIKLSDADAEWLYPNRSAHATAEHWQTLSGATVILTRGSEGATLFSAASTHSAAGVQVAVEDTIGAGDSFAAALLACMTKSIDPEAGYYPNPLAPEKPSTGIISPAMLDFAVRVSATTCTRAGANPPRPAEVIESPRMPPANFSSFARARWVMERLRDPVLGCPWDIEQTHATIMPYTLDEAQEAKEACESGDDDHFRDELGDVLLQVLFHSKIAEERGAFALDDVIEALIAKMVRRHPHVFRPEGRGTQTPLAEVTAAWQADKAIHNPR